MKGRNMKLTYHKKVLYYSCIATSSQ